MNPKIHLVLVVSFFSSISGQLLPPVPCPSVFSYVRNPFNLIEGRITLPYHGEHPLTISVNASMPGIFQKRNATMDIDLLTDPVQIYTRTTNVLDYIVKFSIPETIPQITRIIYNNNVVCSGPEMNNFPISSIPGLRPVLTAVTHIYGTHDLRFQVE